MLVHQRVKEKDMKERFWHTTPKKAANLFDCQAPACMGINAGRRAMAVEALGVTGFGPKNPR